MTFLLPQYHKNQISLYFILFTTEVGWTVKNRHHVGSEIAIHTWITPKEFPSDGIVTHWRYWAGRSVPWRAMVLRKVDNEGTIHDIIGINEIPAGDIEQVVTYQVPDDERITVQSGDVIGFAWNSPGAKVDIDLTVDDVETLKIFRPSVVSPDDLNVNFRLNGTFAEYSRAYSIKAIMSGIVTIIMIVI